MAYEYLGRGALDYFPCRYGSSKLYFRGPERPLDGGYCAVIGSTETYGKYIEDPYPVQLEQFTGKTVLNLGQLHGGVDLLLADPVLLGICKKADTTIIQLTGAQNISNRFYRVHPRRNDRFVGATDALKSLFPEMDFTDFNFTGHLLGALAYGACDRFDLVRRELQKTWVTRMKSVLDQIGGRVILLWLSRHGLNDDRPDKCLLRDPGLVDGDMVEQLVRAGAELVEIVATGEEISAGHDRMIFSVLEEPAARQMLGPIVHQQAALELKALLGAA